MMWEKRKIIFGFKIKTVGKKSGRKKKRKILVAKISDDWANAFVLFCLDFDHIGIPGNRCQGGGEGCELVRDGGVSQVDEGREESQRKSDMNQCSTLLPPCLLAHRLRKKANGNSSTDIRIPIDLFLINSGKGRGMHTASSGDPTPSTPSTSTPGPSSY